MHSDSLILLDYGDLIINKILQFKCLPLYRNLTLNIRTLEIQKVKCKCQENTKHTAVHCSGVQASWLNKNQQKILEPLT